MKLPNQLFTSKDYHLYKKIWNIPHQNNGMVVIIIIGKPNSGKSYAGLHLAKMFDPSFTMEQAIFSPQNFMQQLIKIKGKGKVLFFDDAGISLFNREAMTRQVREMAKVFQSYRFKNCFTILTLPNLYNLEKVVVSVADILIEMQSVDKKKRMSKAKFKWLKTNPITGVIYKKYPLKTVTVPLANGMVIKRKMRKKAIYFEKPDKELLKQYERKKQGYLNNYYLKTSKLFEETPESLAEKKLKKKHVFSEMLERAIPIKSLFKVKEDYELIKIMTHFNIGDTMARRLKQGLELYEQGELEK